MPSAHPALADTPAFDRPGIAFAPATLPAGSMAWEQGAPDVARDSDSGTTVTALALDTRLRFGLTDRLELQVANSLYNRLETRSSAGNAAVSGASDLTLGLKFSSPSGSGPFSWAGLASVSLPVGNQEFSDSSERYSVGATAGWAIGESQSIALYGDVDILRRRTIWTVSPNWSFALNDRVGAYIEAGYSHSGADDISATRAGGGLTFMPTQRVQLDLYGLWGVGGNSTGVESGFGFSVFFP